MLDHFCHSHSSETLALLTARNVLIMFLMTGNFSLSVYPKQKVNNTMREKDSPVCVAYMQPVREFSQLL